MEVQTSSGTYVADLKRKRKQTCEIKDTKKGSMGWSKGKRFFSKSYLSILLARRSYGSANKYDKRQHSGT